MFKRKNELIMYGTPTRRKDGNMAEEERVLPCCQNYITHLNNLKTGSIKKPAGTLFGFMALVNAIKPGTLFKLFSC
ncbi:MAG TPA: hypothetical protein VLS85_07210 [Hanamia sp.]|nr:hypothetical protein [Hanamia sp.]